jgi:hypothetical protein
MMKMKSWLALMLVCVAACGDSTVTNDQVGKEFAFDDPVGDTALFADSVDSYPAIDVRRVSGKVTADSLIFTMEFVNPVTPVTDVAPNSLFATFGIDADNDGMTGTPIDSTDDLPPDVPPFTGPFPARTGVGAEYWIFVDSLSGGEAELYRTLTFETVGTFPISYAGSSMTMRIPLSAIGVQATHPFRIVGIIGTSQRLTDLFPDTSSYLVGGAF